MQQAVTDTSVQGMKLLCDPHIASLIAEYSDKPLPEAGSADAIMLQGFLNTNLRIFENQYLQAKEGLLPGGVDLVLKRSRPMLRSTLFRQHWDRNRPGLYVSDDFASYVEAILMKVD